MKKLLESLRFSLYVIIHPFKGFWDLKHEKKGTLQAAMVLLILLTITYVLKRQATSYLFNFENVRRLNIFTEISKVVVPFMLWCIANWCLTTLMEGEGSFKDIIISVAYAMTPVIIINVPLVLLSHGLVLEESAYYNFLISLGVVWSGFLMVTGMMVTHQYTMKRTLFTSLLTIVGMGILLFIGMLFFSLLQQMSNFAYSIYKEITYRF